MIVIETDPVPGTGAGGHWWDVAVPQAGGPERLSGDWWRDGYRRDYWRCEGEAGDGEFVLYRDRAAAVPSR